MKKSVVIVDLNPDIIRQLIKEKIPCIYGDIGDTEILERLNLTQLELVISTIPSHPDNLLIIERVRAKNPEATIIVTSHSGEEALELYKKGADYVILPHFLGGEHISILLEDLTTNLKKLLQVKVNHIKELEERRKRHPHHR